MKLILFLSLSMILVSKSLFAFDLKTVKFLYCYDGDTCYFNILDSNFPNYLNPMSIRSSHVDTPELKFNKNKKIINDKAFKAKQFTINFIKKAKHLKLVNCKKDKYFRFDCDYKDGKKLLHEELIKAKLGVPYEGGHKT